MNQTFYRDGVGYLKAGKADWPSYWWLGSSRAEAEVLSNIRVMVALATSLLGTTKITEIIFRFVSCRVTVTGFYLGYRFLNP